ncbi:MAG TPA: hypothetical protein VM841_10155 [Actinomycetota bacterium]|nr:hypothetical protein [Actinomycetota bacterium]
MTEKDRIEDLQRALEGEGSSSEETASLLALVRMLEDLPEPEIDPAFAASLEDRIVGGTAESPPAPAAGAPAGGSLAAITRIEERRSRRVRRGLVAAIAATFVMALPVAASAEAVPGSPGYGVRLAREEARLWMTCRAGAVKCGFAHLDRASARLTDLRSVIRRGDVSQVPATSARLRSSVSEGAATVLAAHPPATTLRRLAARLDETAARLGELAASAPPSMRNPIREALGEGVSITHEIKVALGEAPPVRIVPVRPPVAIAPPVVAEPEPDAAPAEDDRSRERTRRPSRKPADKGNSFGPGGTPKVGEPAPGEEWHADDPMRDGCPLGVVAAPGVDPGVTAVCGAAGGGSR